MRLHALELEQAALPAHYQLDKKTLKKLPNELARDLVKSLLMMNEKYRLGHKGAKQVMKHAFFDGIDWEGLKAGTATPPSRPDTSRASVATGEMDLMKLLSGEEEVEEDNLTQREQGERHTTHGMSRNEGGVLVTLFLKLDLQTLYSSLR